MMPGTSRWGRRRARASGSLSRTAETVPLRKLRVGRCPTGISSGLDSGFGVYSRHGGPDFPAVRYPFSGPRAFLPRSHAPHRLVATRTHQGRKENGSDHHHRIARVASRGRIGRGPKLLRDEGGQQRPQTACRRSPNQFHQEMLRRQRTQRGWQKAFRRCEGELCEKVPD